MYIIIIIIHEMKMGIEWCFFFPMVFNLTTLKNVTLLVQAGLFWVFPATGSFNTHIYEIMTHALGKGTQARTCIMYDTDEYHTHLNSLWYCVCVCGGGGGGVCLSAVWCFVWFGGTMLYVCIEYHI